MLRVYDERQPLEPNYPSTKPSVADFTPEENESGFHAVPLQDVNKLEERAEAELRHAPPRLVMPSIAAKLTGSHSKANINNYKALAMLVLGTMSQLRFWPSRTSLGKKERQTSSAIP